MKQFTKLVAKSNFSFKALGAKGRAVCVKNGDHFLITSPQHTNKEVVMIDREKKAKINSGYCFSLEILEQYFIVV